MLLCVIGPAPRAWLQGGKRDGQAARGVCAKQVRVHDGRNHRQRGLARWRQGGLQAQHQRRREVLEHKRFVDLQAGA